MCTGNVCRSPLAALLLRSSLRDLGVVVHSAGTHALVDEAMTPEALQLALANGADADDAARHRGRLVQERMLIEADLTLTMTREHRAFAVQLAPSRLHRVFPVREFARLAATMTDDELLDAAEGDGDNTRARLGSTVIAISHRRGLTAGGTDEDDVIDPYRRSAEVYERSARELVPALAQVERVVRLALS
ncbi:low molecular weight phosphatase family protein [Microbacterium sp. EF45047]|nr:low molecular weight phosphatase family protein [Microbacterium neungamense]WCM56763.1 low molecular weight phosphatase family protein [Microbacterium sp. EF45047]